MSIEIPGHKSLDSDEGHFPVYALIVQAPDVMQDRDALAGMIDESEEYKLLGESSFPDGFVSMLMDMRPEHGGEVIRGIFEAALRQIIGQCASALGVQAATRLVAKSLMHITAADGGEGDGEGDE